jgi:hypothetical protein
MSFQYDFGVHPGGWASLGDIILPDALRAVSRIPSLQGLFLDMSLLARVLIAKAARGSKV